MDTRPKQASPDVTHQVYFIEHSRGHWAPDNVTQMDAIFLTGHENKYYAPDFTEASVDEVQIAKRAWKKYKKTYLAKDTRVTRPSRKGTFKQLWSLVGEPGPKPKTDPGAKQKYPVINLLDDDVNDFQLTDVKLTTGLTGKPPTRQDLRKTTLSTSGPMFAPLRNTGDSSVYNEVHTQAQHAGLKMAFTAVKLQEETIKLTALKDIEVKAAVSEANYLKEMAHKEALLAKVEDSMQKQADYQKKFLEQRTDYHKKFLETVMALQSGSQKVSTASSFFTNKLL